MNVGKYLIENNSAPEKVFLVHGKENFTFGQVSAEARKVGAYLHKCGLVKGDRVLILDDSSFFWVSSYLGTLIAGGVTVPLPSNIEPEKFEKILFSCSPKRAFVGRRYWERYRDKLEGIPVVVNGGDTECEVFNDLPKTDHPSETCFQEIDPFSDLAALMYTSGSTGEPRGVMVTHQNIMANTQSIIQYLSLTSKDRIMAVLPFYYCFGTSLLHTHLKVGGSVVIENSFLYPEKILNQMQEAKCTGLAGVPSTYQILLKNSTFRKREFPELRYFQQAGGKLPDNFIEEIIHTFPRKELFVMYGQTEATARLSFLPPEFLNNKLGSIGKGIPGVRLEVLDPQGNSVEPGQVGEIVATGENIAAGYWNAPEETARSFRNGKLYTGDLATVDEKGFIFVVDREKEFIKCAGHRVSSKEIEGILVRMEGIIEAAVLPMPDEQLGEAICAFVSHVCGEAATDDVKKYCTRNIKWPITPRKIVCLKSLPKNSSGKVDKVRLKKILKGDVS